MAIGTVLGLALGLGLISVIRPVGAFSWLVTQFFRNAPWLVLLFYCILLMPFEVRIAGIIVPLPGWAKSTAGLTLPVMANVAELVRGAVQSIPAGQWEASEALAFSRLQTLRLVILPHSSAPATSSSRSRRAATHRTWCAHSRSRRNATR